jgi:putative oxidoreductase
MDSNELTQQDAGGASGDVDIARDASARTLGTTDMDSKDRVGEGAFERAVLFALRLANKASWLPPLMMRLFVGYFFFETGWGKLHNLDAFTQRFVGWGIPWPAFMAPLSAWTELIGGALSVVGLGTRLVSGPLIINMLVAILAVNLKHVSSLDDFVELDEPLYALCYLWLMIDGPGCVSLDYLIVRAFKSRRTSPAVELPAMASRQPMKPAGIDT